MVTADRQAEQALGNYRCAFVPIVRPPEPEEGKQGQWFCVGVCVEGIKGQTIHPTADRFHTFEVCHQHCEELNAEQGLTDDDVFDIVRSTMRLTFLKRGWRYTDVWSRPRRRRRRW